VNSHRCKAFVITTKKSCYLLSRDLILPMTASNPRTSLIGCSTNKRCIFKETFFEPPPQNVSIIIGRNSSRNVKEPASTPCYSQYADGLKILNPFSLQSSVFYRTQCHSTECGHCHTHLQNPWSTFFGQFAAAPCHTQIPNRLMSSRVSLQK